MTEKPKMQFTGKYVTLLIDESGMIAQRNSHREGESNYISLSAVEALEFTDLLAMGNNAIGTLAWNKSVRGEME